MINYQIISDALNYYTRAGYQRIETPWVVPKAVSAITWPSESPQWGIRDTDDILVASGEQSFLNQYLRGFLPKGRFITVTPCFRDDNYDLTHLKYFIKAELIDTEIVSDFGLNRMINRAFDFFAENLGSKNRLEIVKIGPETFDIELDGQEIGSYGIRSCSFLRWVYGTGVAEPRFSMLRDQNGISSDEDS